MNTAVYELAQSILAKPLQECSIEELDRITHQFPYFGPAQLLFAKKLQQENSSQYEEQVQKASLYFENRLWLHHLLRENSQEEFFSSGRSTEEHKTQQPDKRENEPESFIEQALHKNLAVQETNIHRERDELPEISIEEQAAHRESSEDNTNTPSASEPGASASELTFEPYHTVDYFASQGIKFREEDKPKDRFSQQLKSFTEWLKTMKRIPVSEITTGTDTSGEKKVEQLAEHSLAEREVVTEAMAEVWEKQGNTAKAEEIYRKLSLLDPPKSSYFAAKIDELKKTS